MLDITEFVKMYYGLSDIIKSMHLLALDTSFLVEEIKASLSDMPIDYAPGLSWFMTRFESKGAYGCRERWHARDMRVYTSSSLREDKNPTSCVCWCILIRWVETPSTPPFIG
jgi:hypothetical protein